MVGLSLLQVPLSISPPRALSLRTVWPRDATAPKRRAPSDPAYPSMDAMLRDMSTARGGTASLDFCARLLTELRPRETSHTPAPAGQESHTPHRTAWQRVSYRRGGRCFTSIYKVVVRLRRPRQRPSHEYNIDIIVCLVSGAWNQMWPQIVVVMAHRRNTTTIQRSFAGCIKTNLSTTCIYSAAAQSSSHEHCHIVPLHQRPHFSKDPANTVAVNPRDLDIDFYGLIS